MKKLFYIVLFITSQLLATDENFLNSLKELENHHLEKLLSNNISLSPIDGKSPLNQISININFYSKVKLLVDAGIDLNFIDKDGNNIIQNYQNLIKRYDKLYDKIKSHTPQEIQKFNDIPPIYKKTVLQKNGKKTVLRSISYSKMLIKRAIKLVYKNSHKLTQAIIDNDTTLALQLIKNGANLYQYGNAESIKKIVTPHLKTTYVGGMDYDVYPLVVLAAASGNVKVIKAMHNEFEFSIYLKDKYKNDALMWAARQGKSKVVKLLLDYGFDPLYEASNTTAYDLSIRFDKTKVLKIFIKKLLKEKKYKKLSYTIWAMARRESDVVELLINAGVKDDFKGINPRTSLIKVAEMGNIERFKLLVWHGSDPYESNIGKIHYGYNPLIAAINNSQKMAIYLLKNYNYDLSQIYEGNNLLHIAYNHYKKSDKDFIKLILQKSKIDINSKNKYGQTALQVAVSDRDKEYVEFFLSLGYSKENLNQAIKIVKEKIKMWQKQYKRVKSPYNLEQINKAKEVFEILETKLSY